MATVSLRVLRDDNSSITATKTIADGDITRMMNALASIFNKTPAQVLDYTLTRILNQGIAMTKQNEQNNVPVNPILYS